MFMWSSILIMIFSLTIFVLGLGAILAKKFLSSRVYSSPFECGVSNLMEWRKAFSIQFFMLALIFLIFDVELILLFPALSLEIEFMMSSSLLLFYIVFALGLGLFIEWKNSIMEWIY